MLIIVACSLTALLTFQLGVSPAAAQEPLTPFAVGEAGHYAGPEDVNPLQPPGTPVVGSCGYGEVVSTVWPGFNSAAISVNSTLFSDPGSPKDGCGRCIEVQCIAPNCPPGAAPLIAQVQDRCASCPPTRFNLPYIVWTQSLSVDPKVGSVRVNYRRVECNPPGTIVVNLQEFRATLGGFIKFALDSVKGSGILTGVSLRQTPPAEAAPGPWLPLANTNGAVWEGSNLPPPPYDLQFAGPTATLDAENVIPVGAMPGRLPTNVQFP